MIEKQGVELKTVHNQLNEYEAKLREVTKGSALGTTLINIFTGFFFNRWFKEEKFERDIFIEVGIYVSINGYIFNRIIVYSELALKLHSKDRLLRSLISRKTVWYSHFKWDQVAGKLKDRALLSLREKFLNFKKWKINETNIYFIYSNI